MDPLLNRSSASPSYYFSTTGPSRNFYLVTNEHLVPSIPPSPISQVTPPLTSGCFEGAPTHQPDNQFVEVRVSFYSESPLIEAINNDVGSLK